VPLQRGMAILAMRGPAPRSKVNPAFNFRLPS
jgi:hypothetical protein